MRSSDAAPSEPWYARGGKASAIARARRELDAALSEGARVRRWARHHRKKTELLENLVDFTHEACGFKDVSPTLHGQVERFIRSAPATVVLLPREHLKSSFITVGDVCQRIARDPNVRICIASVTEDLSKRFLRQIKSILRSRGFQRYWGKHVPPDFAKDTADQLEIKGRSHTTREPTVYATSVGASQIGFHFDHILYDDIVDNNTVRTKASMDACWQWFTESLALQDQDSTMVYVGTRWHDYDVAGRLLEDRTYRHMVRSAIENGQVIFPEKFSLRRLELLRKRMPRRVFSCQYLNDPIPVEDQTFQEDWLGEITGHAPPEGPTFLTCDPATGDGDDYAAIVVVRTDHFGRIVICEIIRQRVPPKALIDLYLDACERWNPTIAGLEQNALQKTLGHWLQDVMVRTGRMFLVQELKTTRQKEDRILALEPYFRSGRIHIWTGCNHKADLLDEMIRFPRARTDDILDALAHALELLTYPDPPSEGPRPLPEPEQLYREWLTAEHSAALKPASRRTVLGRNAVRRTGRRDAWQRRASTFPGIPRFPGGSISSRTTRGR